jgi:hypothetical protein
MNSRCCIFVPSGVTYASLSRTELHVNGGADVGADLACETTAFEAVVAADMTFRRSRSITNLQAVCISIQEML